MSINYYKERSDIKMFQNILRSIDILTIILSVTAIYSMVFMETDLINSLLIILSPLLLLIAKYKGSRTLLFLAYLCTTIFFTSIIYNALSTGSTDYFHSGASSFFIALIAITVSLSAAIIGFGTNTLTILWISLHILVLRQTLILYSASAFFEHFWSEKALDTVIRHDYPFILMIIWLGLFLDKYQRELSREYISR